MANKRAAEKSMISFWATNEEKALLHEAAKAAGFDTLAAYLRWIAETKPKPGERPEAPKDKGH